MENVPKCQKKRCPHCYKPLVLSRFGPAGRPVYFCEHCVAPVLNPVQDPEVRISKSSVPVVDSRHCPRCASEAARFLKMTLYGQEVRCRTCAKVYIVAANFMIQNGNGLPIIYQGAES